jgi:hypothetical protein
MKTDVKYDVHTAENVVSRLRRELEHRPPPDVPPLESIIGHARATRVNVVNQTVFIDSAVGLTNSEVSAFFSVMISLVVLTKKVLITKLGAGRYPVAPSDREWPLDRRRHLTLDPAATVTPYTTRWTVDQRDKNNAIRGLLATELNAATNPAAVAASVLVDAATVCWTGLWLVREKLPDLSSPDTTLAANRGNRVQLPDDVIGLARAVVLSHELTPESTATMGAGQAILSAPTFTESQIEAALTTLLVGGRGRVRFTMRGPSQVAFTYTSR